MFDSIVYNPYYETTKYRPFDDTAIVRVYVDYNTVDLNWSYSVTTKDSEYVV